MCTCTAPQYTFTSGAHVESSMKPSFLSRILE
jgi:hypothetical protein